MRSDLTSWHWRLFQIFVILKMSHVYTTSHTQRARKIGWQGQPYLQVTGKFMKTTIVHWAGGLVACHGSGWLVACSWAVELPRSNNEEWHDILALEAIVMHVATQKGWSIIIIWNWGWKKVSLTRTAGELSKLRLASFTTKPNEWWRISARNIHSCTADWLTHPPTSLFKT